MSSKLHKTRKAEHEKCAEKEQILILYVLDETFPQHYDKLEKNSVGEGGREILSIETNGFRGSFRTIFTKTLQPIKLFNNTIMVRSI